MLKNMSIRKKLLTACSIIALLGCIIGIVSIVMMRSITSQYNDALNRYGFAQGDVGELLAAFCRVDGNVHDAISYQNAEDRQAAESNIEKWSQEVDSYFDVVESELVSQQTKDTFQQARDAWGQYQQTVQQLLDRAGSATDSAGLQTLQEQLVEELDPLYTEVYDGMGAVMEDKVTTGDALAATISRNSTVAIVSIVVLLVVAVLMALLCSTKLSRDIATPMQQCSKRLRQLAEGDLQTEVPAYVSQDETGELADSTRSIVASLTSMINDIDYLLGEMAKGNFDVHSKDVNMYKGDFASLVNSLRNINTNLSDTLGQIRQSAEQVAAGAEQVSNSAQALAQGATEQASAVEELSATIDEISKGAQSNAQDAQQSRSNSEQAGQKLGECMTYMDQMVSAMSDITHSSDEISKIIGTIENIAFQTNILALNAAVEAARAGTAGKGFAVVADEVRNLASKSDQAAKATKELIENSIQSVSNGSQIVDTVSNMLKEVEALAGKSVSSVVEISGVMEQEAESIAQVTEGIDQISAVVQTNSATSEESAAASEELSSQAALMRQILANFQLAQPASQGLGQQPLSATPDPMVRQEYQEEGTGGLETAAANPFSKY